MFEKCVLSIYKELPTYRFWS